MPRRRPPRMVRGARRPPSCPCTVAPICRRGIATRSIGRPSSWALPVSTLRNGCPAMIPASRRIVVPDPPQSSGTAGSRSRPIPCTTTSVGPDCSTVTPRSRTTRSVARQSLAARKLWTRVGPSASAPNSTARWLIDLSPGTRTVPPNGRRLPRMTSVSASPLLIQITSVGSPVRPLNRSSAPLHRRAQ